MTEIGHNSGTEMDESVFHRHVSEMARADEQLEIAKTKRKNARNAFKASGGILGDFDDMKRLRDLGHEQAVETFKRRAVYGRRLGVFPKGMQPDLFDGVVADPIEEKAFEDGRWAGLNGKALEECPHDQTISTGQKWMEGWHEGRAIWVDADRFNREDVSEIGPGKQVEPMGPDDVDDDDDEGSSEDDDPRLAP